MNLINRSNLVEELFLAFPELQSDYVVDQYLSDGKDPSAYLVVSFLFKPRFKAELEKAAISAFLGRSAEFIERVCISDDPEAVNALWVSLFEYLIFRPDDLRLLWPVLGSRTREKIRDAAKRWGQSDGLPDS